MPNALRGSDPSTIMGLPQLSAADKKKVREANCMLEWVVKLIKRCLQLNIAGYLENPLSSRVWKTAPVKALLQEKKVQFVKSDFCMYDMPWKKPIGLLVFNSPEVKLCRCRKKGVCSRTGKPHLQLTGVAGKRFLTQQAQV